MNKNANKDEIGWIQAAEYAQSIKRGPLGEKGYRAFYQNLGRSKRKNDKGVKEIKSITHITQDFADRWKRNYNPRQGQGSVRKRVALSKDNFLALKKIMDKFKTKNISSFLTMVAKGDLKVVHGAGE